jgi:hypothetical protein|tara:strand:- start:872 stop:1051 length:180 start_codon:yes stop_codon:yes gene_type:complete
MNWKDKRIEEINKLNTGSGPDSPYFDEVQKIYKSTAKSLEEFRIELENEQYLEEIKKKL